ncbi:MAG: DUF4416 family protein [Thermodesulfobacteriota bacterium]
MSKLQEPPLVALFISIIFNEDSELDNCINDLLTEYGETELISSRFDFDFSDYYNEEMGNGLSRKFISFKKLISRDKIVDIKIYSNMLEEQYSTGGNRTINLDPGYLSAEHLVLSTGKGFSHRPYLNKGVYADLTLLYQDNKFKSLDWTYPDYKTEQIQNYFYELRKLYLNRLRKGN